MSENFSLEYLEEVASGDISFIIEMIDMFIISAPGLVSEIEDAKNKLDNKNMSTVLHKLKSPMTLFEIKKGSAMILHIENELSEKQNFQHLYSELDSLIQLLRTVCKELHLTKMKLN